MGVIPAGNLVEMCKKMEKEEWLEYCVSMKIAHAYYKEVWDMAHPQANATIVEDQEVTGRMCSCLENFEFDFTSMQCLVLIGPSGCGKTTWAKKHSPKPALFVTHMDRLREFDARKHKSIIFDDMSFQHMPREAQIHLVDQYNSNDIHIRYSTCFIPAKIKRIFTANFHPLTLDDAIGRRTRTFIIKP